MAVNQLQKPRDLITSSDLCTGLDVITAEQDYPAIRRSRRSTQNETVVLSSKFVVGRIRSRHESIDTNDTGAYWCEFPKPSAESLEKRGIEVVPQTLNATVQRSIPTAILGSLVISKNTKQKRDAKGKSVKRNRSTSGVRDRRPLDYYLTAHDLEWVTLYNHIAQNKKMKRIAAEQFETTINMLEKRKNEIVIKRMKFVISAICKTIEGTSRRFEKEYQALQKFIEITPDVLPIVNYNAIGTLAGLAESQSFDIWEYWKCRLQDEFYQPLIPPSVPDFDYRRISLIAAWNMTSVSYAKRIRHDAERIRLMYDLLQKRNLVLAKSFTKEEEVEAELSELLISTDGRHLSPHDLANMNIFVQDSSVLARKEEREPKDEFLTSFHRFVQQSLEELPETKETESSATIRRLSFTVNNEREQSPLEHSAPLPEALPEPVRTDEKFEESTSARRKGKLQERKMPLTTRVTRARLEPVRPFEHGDNSCCENGPLDDEELLNTPLMFDHLIAGLKSDSDLDTEETLYMLNSFSLDDSGIVLQEFNTPSKPSDLRSRLRSRKPRVS